MSNDRNVAYVAAEPIPPSKPPAPEVGVIRWLRRNLFNGVVDSILTLISITAIMLLVPPLIDWAVLKGVWNAISLDECREIVVATHGKGAHGACWAVFNGRIDQLLFGFYPSELYWRPVLAFVLLFVALAPVLFSSLPRRMLWFSAIYPIIAFVLILGIAEQHNRDLVRELATSAGMNISTAEGMKAAWIEFSSTRFTHLGEVRSSGLGGFLLTIVIAVTGIAVALPVGIVLALGRQSSMFFFRAICAPLLEFIRGVPLIVLLFAASTLLNYFLPPGTNFDVILRIVLVMALTSGVYMAEAIRGGLAALPSGQYEAVDALGLNYWQATRLIILPQALKISMPQIVRTSIGLFRDTSLVSIIGILDPIGLLNPIRADTDWNGVLWELFAVIALFYWIFCFSMSRYARYLENKLKADQ